MDRLTLAIVAVIAAIFVWALLNLWRGRRQATRFGKFVESAPGIMTSVGVFGTFLGIAVALSGFDVNDIDRSVPLLLDGMKTAFWSSVAGLLGAIAFRIFRTLTEPAPTVATSNDPLEILRDMNAGIARQTQAITGDEDTSLLTQLKLARTEAADGRRQATEIISESLKRQTEAVSEGFERQITAFDAFAKQMAEQNSKALIQALEEVIRDFNDKLTEQFGENFKQLNQGVEKLVTWQDTYKAHVQQMESRIELAVAALEKTQAAVEGVASATQVLPTHVEAFEAVTKNAGVAIGAVGGLLVGIESLSGRVGEAYPKIEQNMVDLTTNLEAASKTQAKSLENAGAELEKTIRSQSDALAEASAEQARQLESVASDLAEQTRENLTTLQTTMTGSFEAFDTQMQDETQRVLQQLGEQLASITNKITRDYSEFADAAGVVVRAAGQIDRRAA